MKTFLFALVIVVTSTTFAVAQNATIYGGECAREVTPVSTFNCSDGVEVPVTVDGVSPETYTPGQSCDRPSLLPPFPVRRRMDNASPIPGRSSFATTTSRKSASFVAVPSFGR